MNPDIQREYDARLMTAAEAVKTVKSGDTVYIGTCTSLCLALCEALGERMGELRGLTVCGSNLFPELKIMGGAYPVRSFFMGPRERAAVSGGWGDFTSFHLSELDQWCQRIEPPDVAFFEVSPPDEEGRMSYGASGVCLNDYLRAAAKRIILQVNPNVPYVYGQQNLIRPDEADAIVEAAGPLTEVSRAEDSDVFRAISAHVVELIPDGSCIQIGIGAASDAIGYALRCRNDLGIYSELMTDSLMCLMKNGNATNRLKNYFPGKSLVSFALGSGELYRFLDKNEDMFFQPMPVLNDVRNVSRNDNMVSINSALSIDLMGQVVADNIQGRQYSGVGGQLDFVRGAQMAKNGRSFIAFASTYTKKDGSAASRIVPALAPGTAVTTTRADVQYVATEYGCVNLKLLNMQDRVRALIGLAHPDFRDGMADEARRIGLLR